MNYWLCKSVNIHHNAGSVYWELLKADKNKLPSTVQNIWLLVGFQLFKT